MRCRLLPSDLNTPTGCRAARVHPTPFWRADDTQRQRAFSRRVPYPAFLLVALSGREWERQLQSMPRRLVRASGYLGPLSLPRLPPGHLPAFRRQRRVRELPSWCAVFAFVFVRVCVCVCPGKVVKPIDVSRVCISSVVHYFVFGYHVAPLPQARTTTTALRRRLRRTTRWRTAPCAAPAPTAPPRANPTAPGAPSVRRFGWLVPFHPQLRRVRLF